MRVNFNINEPCKEELNRRKVEKIMKSTYTRERKEFGLFGDIVREEAKKLKELDFIEEELQKELSIDPIEKGEDYGTNRI